MARRGVALVFVGLVAGAIASPASAEETVLPIAGDVPGDGLDHFRVPFEVPEGIVEIEVRHDDLSMLNVLGWGLEDPSGRGGRGLERVWMHHDATGGSRVVAAALARGGTVAAQPGPRVGSSP